MATIAIPVTTMYDTIGDDAGNIPANAAKVAGYVTGSGGILWPQSAWDRLANAGKVRVDQSETLEVYAAGLADVGDMEEYAGTPARFAMGAAERHGRNEPNCAYGSHDTLEQLAAALDAVQGMQKDWWHGTTCWVADPSLSLAEASRLIGTTMFGGLLVVAVQWATPTSNPDTAVGTGTLKSLNLDLSVARSDWFPGKPGPEAWQVQALNAARAAAAAAAQVIKLLGDNL
jgi:hypothetical protein